MPANVPPTEKRSTQKFKQSVQFVSAHIVQLEYMNVVRYIPRHSYNQNRIYAVRDNPENRQESR